VLQVAADTLRRKQEAVERRAKRHAERGLSAATATPASLLRNNTPSCPISSNEQDAAPQVLPLPPLD
jgi:hypothetical protein